MEHVPAKSTSTAISAIIEARHSCSSSHIETIGVSVSRSETAAYMDVIVELHELFGHPLATKCYGWIENALVGEKGIITVLRLPPVFSAESAVRAAGRMAA
jgi:hypothetical protein